MSNPEMPPSNISEESSLSSEEIVREKFLEEIRKRAEKLGIPEDEYLSEYVKSEQANRETIKSPSNIFELTNPSGPALNYAFHENVEKGFLADRDPLTGLFNRRAFLSEIDRRQMAIHKIEKQEKFQNHPEVDRRTENHQESPGYYSILFIDADHFKDINTKYGHDAGDSVLKGITAIIQENIRAGEGVVARWGGEEVVALVPGDINVACLIAERIRNAVEQETFSDNKEKKDSEEKKKVAIKVTISIGVSPYNQDHLQQITIADMAVQAAKGDFNSVERLLASLQTNTSKMRIHYPANPTTRNQIWFVKEDGLLSRYEKPEKRAQ